MIGFFHILTALACIIASIAIVGVEKREPELEFAKASCFVAGGINLALFLIGLGKAL